METKHTISVLVENEFGVLARVAGLFSSKGYNIDSLSVSATPDPSLSHMTILTHGSEHIVEQIIKQLNKLVNVLHVADVNEKTHVMQEMILIKLKGESKAEVMDIIHKLGATLLDHTDKTLVVQMTGDEKQLEKVIQAMKPFGILDIIRTGVIAIERGEVSCV